MIIKKRKEKIDSVTVMKMKHSIRKQLAAIFILLMIGTILLCWFLNSAFLEKYYISNKQNVLIDAYEKMNVASDQDELSTDDFSVDMQKLSGKYNISMVIADADLRTLAFSFENSNVLIQRLMDKLFGVDPKKGEILEKEDVYVIENSFDPRTQTEYIEMWGVLNSGQPFLIRTPVEGIKDSVSISNRFLMYAGILVSLLSGFVIWVITKRMMQPIHELALISEKMTNLDFDAKYEGKGKNEIAVLGIHINQLSTALETTIKELKNANNVLKKDIAQKEEIDEMRKEFLSNVSHELKTPIALIQGYAEGLQMGINEDADSRDFYCDVIIDEANKMNMMVKKLLDLNQLEFGNDVINLERFDVGTLIRTYIQSADILLKQNDIKIIFECEEPVFVWADQFKTEEVFNNYFTNAMNHCDGIKEITVAMEQRDGKVRITVKNTGKQIPDESIEHLWEKFYKVDKARTREYGGSGVGLSIVKAIMDSMNQKYGVENLEDGVVFWFELELANAMVR